MSPRVSIHNTVKGARVPRQKLTRLADIVLTGPHRKREVNLVFITDARMKNLNKQYRGKDRSTDVLSFNLDEDGDPLIGEIYISIAQARRNAVEYGVSPTSEILRLFCHGLLHLRGIHHPDEKSTAMMNRMMEKYLGKLDSGEAR